MSIRPSRVVGKAERERERESEVRYLIDVCEELTHRQRHYRVAPELLEMSKLLRGQSIL